ncbi:MAG: STAS domain-containing protein [Actinobacteria bacterium]|nr:STAS domain-containing protein [Actinomycetota bacterium]
MTLDGPDFSIVFSRALGRVIVHVHGALDWNTAHQLKHRLIDVIDGQGNRDLVLDLKGMTSIDSGGIAVLVDALKRLQKRGGDLVLSGPTATVAAALEAVGLDKVFDITPAWSHPSNGEVRNNVSGRVAWGRPG